MKPPYHFIVLATACCSSLSYAVEKQALPLSESTTARVLGDLPDGTPPPPERAKPGFSIPAKDVVETEIHHQGGRKIIVREIAPIALPPSPMAEPPFDKTSPAVQARIAAFRAKHPQNETIRLSATVYRPKGPAPRTHATYWPNGDEQPVKFWSSADFSLLWGFAAFTDSDGQTRSLMMTWSTLDIDLVSRLHENHGIPYNAPKIPELSPGKATFVITAGNPTLAALATIQSLHDLYNNDYDRLLAAYQSREQARLQQEAQLKAHPPKPKDIILSYSLTDSADQAVKGGAQ